MASFVGVFVLAFLFAVLPGKPLIAWLRRLKAGQNVSADAPQSHAVKQGTPTMGGLLILFSLSAVTVPFFFITQIGAYRREAQDYTLPAILLLTLAFGAIGFADDYLGLRRGKNLGLRAREKFAAQCLVAAGFLFWLFATSRPGLTTMADVAPQGLLGPHSIELGWLYYPLAFLLIVGLSNATNFTDGLDGLSSGVTILISLALAALVAVIYPALGYYCVGLAGALMGFLWWNAHPARVFMGDTASLALGAGLAGVAIVGKQEVALIIASLVCWAELISVMVQVGTFKHRRRKHGLEYARAHRVFRRTPLHHHFEELGIPETRVVQHFWIASALCAALALLWGRG